MARFIGQTCIGLALFVLVTQFDHKVGVGLAELLKGMLHIFETVGKSLPIGAVISTALPAVVLRALSAVSLSSTSHHTERNN